MPEIESIPVWPPRLEDDMAAFNLVGSYPPLDSNPSYCNLLQCSHFASTSVAAESDGELVDFISAYAIPKGPDALFA